MEITQALVILASLLLVVLSTWLLLHLLSYQARAPSKDANGDGGRRIPSPPALPVVGHLHLLKKPLHRSLAALAARYGGGRDGAGLLLLRFGARPVLFVSSPAVAEECFTVHDVALADRPGLASRRMLTEDCPTIATAGYGPRWRHLRRIATVHALCAHRLAATATARDAEARAMAGKLWHLCRDHHGAAAATVSVRSAAYEFVVNVIMSMVAGTRMAEDDVLRFKTMTEAGFAAAGAANRHDFLPALRLLDFGRVKRRLAALAKERHDFGQRVVDEYRRRPHDVAVDDDASPPATRTVIGDLLRQQEKSPESYDDDVIRSVCLSLLQAGTDTSASTIEWAMALLLNNPDVLEKATAEIDSVVGVSRLHRESDLAGLPYLRCVIMETLRLYPLAPHLVPHEASRDCVIAGHAVTRGTIVLVDMYSMQRDPYIWKHPDKFRPERFEEESKFMMPFGMGRRKCPGEGLALRTVGVALGVMLQCFKWERTGKEKVDMSEGSGLTMPMAVPLTVVCQPRAKMESVLVAL
ncbi:hypothetical protein ABZP36_033671 [Zizania latifolia]